MGDLMKKVYFGVMLVISAVQVSSAFATDTRNPNQLPAPVKVSVSTACTSAASAFISACSAMGAANGATFGAATCSSGKISAAAWAARPQSYKTVQAQFDAAIHALDAACATGAAGVAVLTSTLSQGHAAELSACNAGATPAKPGVPSGPQVPLYHAALIGSHVVNVQ
jgi:hypothetical protein